MWGAGEGNAVSFSFKLGKWGNNNSQIQGQTTFLKGGLVNEFESSDRNGQTERSIQVGFWFMGCDSWESSRRHKSVRVSQAVGATWSAIKTIVRNKV